MANFSPFFLTIILIIMLTTTASSSPPSSLPEAEILLKLKSSLKDPLNFLSNWSSTSSFHHCNWTGVECTNGPFVASISLPSFNLSGEISSSICDLPHLTSLVLEDNQFKTPFPVSILKCKSLTVLRLGKNQIYGEIPNGISQLSSLKKFDLNRNQIEGKVPPSLGNLTGLCYIDLSYNNLTGSIPRELQMLHLCLFDVSFNQLSGRVPFPLVLFTCASYLQGNKGLCGFGVPDSCWEDDLLFYSVNLVMGLSVSFCCALLGYACITEFKTKPQKNARPQSQFYQPLKSTENGL